MYEKRFKEIEARKLEIRAMLETGEEVNLEEIQSELRSLEDEANKLNARMQVIKNLEGNKENKGNEMRKLDQTGENRETKVKEEAEKRGQALKEMRSITVGNSEIVLPQYQASDIKPTFNEVSSLVDRVEVKPLMGGESFDQPYEKGTGEGGYTGQGADYSATETVFDYATIAKTKITAYQEEPEEMLKLPNADYDGRIVNGVRTSLRKKLAKEILVGDGATGHLVGIFSSNATAIDVATDLALTEIDETTLDNIIYSYGGPEDVEDGAVLILNKQDLKAFATLRDADGKKVYEVVNKGNTGTIDGVPFIINSACKAIANAAVTAGEYCMAYGPLSNYMMAVFSDVDVQRSTDYKFKQGMIAHKGAIFAGGNVVAKNGFLRVKKGA